MKLHNKSGHAFQHSHYDKNFNLVIVEIKAGEVKEIDDEIAKKWLATGQVVEYVAPQEARALEDENKELKAKIAELEKVAKKEEVKEEKPKAKAAKK